MNALVNPLVLGLEPPLRVLMISKACLVGAYQTKLEEIARLPGVDLTVLVPSTWKSASHTAVIERAHTMGYRLVCEPLRLNGHYHLHFYPRLAARFRELRPEILHMDEEPYNLATFLAFRIARRHGSKTIWFSWQNLNRRYPLPFRLMEGYCIRHADHAIVGSEGAARVWRAKGYRGPMAIIPQFGVSLEAFEPRPTRRDSACGFRIGYVGRLVREKGVDVLIDALSDVDGEWRLVIAGAGPERARLEYGAQLLGVGDRVSFAGHIASTRMPAFYRTLDALVLPSRTQPNWAEQFGRVLVEAMACGVPVVGSDCGEIPDVVGDAGLIFREGEADELRRCLVRLMREPRLWSVLATRGRERVTDKFDQREIARRTVLVYRSLMSAALPSGG